MRHTTSQQPTLRCPPAVLSAIALLCLLALLLSGGCAKPESRSWAQTSPVIMPEKRPAADSTVHRAAPGAEIYAGPAEPAIELN